MKQFLCEPEDRIGSQASVSAVRPDSFIQSQRRSGYFGTFMGGSTDGAEFIKVLPADINLAIQLNTFVAGSSLVPGS
jgi:protein-serine/threonine kinase